MNRSITTMVVALALAWGAAAPPQALSPVQAAPAAAGAPLRLVVETGAVSGSNIPVSAKIELGAEWSAVLEEEIRVQMRTDDADNAATLGQVVKLTGNEAELWWILPEAKAETATTWRATLSRGAGTDKDTSFSWRDEAGAHLDLLLGGKPVTRYMYAYDTSSKERTHETYKPFHHVFDAAGNIITKGPGGQFTHHRGLFIGWPKVGFEGKTYDLWHMSGVAQVHQKFLKQTAGPVLARATALIHWNDKEGQPIITEERETTVFRQPAPAIMLLDFHTRLTAVRGDVVLNGDPEHGGFHYRPHDDAGKPIKAGATGTMKDKITEASAYQFDKEGVDPHKVKDLPWAGMSYALHEQRYSVQHMNHPTNPQGTLYSAYRDYGRFGAFFKHDIKSGETLDLRFRVRVTSGPMPSREEMSAHWAAFAHPPVVKLGS